MNAEMAPGKSPIKCLLKWNNNFGHFYYLFQHLWQYWNNLSFYHYFGQPLPKTVETDPDYEQIVPSIFLLSNKYLYKHPEKAFSFPANYIRIFSVTFPIASIRSN